MALYLEREIMLLEDTKAYLYRWTHIPTGKWYVGARTANGSHPEDGYYCSSKQVKPMILQNPNEWKREILSIGEPKYILNLEAKYLTACDAKNDPMSFNMHNGDGNFTTLGTTWTDAQRNKAKVSYSASRKGKEKSLSHRNAISTGVTSALADVVRGYYVSPTGQRFDRVQKAADAYGVTRRTIALWVKNGKNGWSYEPKESA